MTAFKHYTSICNSGPSEFLATLALRHKETLVQRNRAIIQANIQSLDGFFARHQSTFSWSPPKGGSTAFPKLRLDVHVEEFCADLAEKQGVLLLPSTHFDYGTQNFRLGLGRKNLRECLEQLEDYLNKSDYLVSPIYRNNSK